MFDLSIPWPDEEFCAALENENGQLREENARLRHIVAELEKPFIEKEREISKQLNAEIERLKALLSEAVKALEEIVNIVPRGVFTSQCPVIAEEALAKLRGEGK